MVPGIVVLRCTGAYSSIVNVLTGKHLLVTRAAEQCEAVVRLAEQHGATAICFPCLSVQCLSEEIREGMMTLSDGAVIVLSSANGVHCAARAFGDAFASIFGRHAVVAIGEHTAEALSAHGVATSWVAEEASQEGLIRGFTEHGLPSHVCFLRAEEGRDLLPRALQARGVEVQIIHAYRTVCPEGDASEVVQALKQNQIDAVLLGSSRTVMHYVQRLGDIRLANRPAVAVISPQVARAAKAQGLSVQAVAKQASFPAMFDALADYFAKTRFDVEETRP